MHVFLSYLAASRWLLLLDVDLLKSDKIEDLQDLEVPNSVTIFKNDFDGVKDLLFLCHRKRLTLVPRL
jgi:hypothetical protein